MKKNVAEKKSFINHSKDKLKLSLKLMKLNRALESWALTTAIINNNSKLKNISEESGTEKVKRKFLKTEAISADRNPLRL